MSTVSSQKLFFRLFPPPAYLRMPAVGVDISDGAVKMLELESTPNEIRVAQYATYELPQGSILNGEIRSPEGVTDILRRLYLEHNVRFVHASLPQEHAYLFQTDIAATTPAKQIRTSIEFKLKENIPLSPEEVLFDFKPLPVNERGSERYFAVSAYPIELVEQYLMVFREAGIRVLSFETEGEASARAITPFGGLETIMVVDIGRAGTEVSIVYQGMLLFTVSLEVSSEAFTEAVERFMQVSSSDAERIKLARGFTKSDENEELFEALLGPVSNLRDEINKHLTYWHMHRGPQAALHRDVERIVFTGGGSNLRGLHDYFSATMSLPVSVADVWVNVTNFDTYIPPLEKHESLSYATAVGLALKTLS